MHPDIDPGCYLDLYDKTGLLNTVFPGMHHTTQVPGEFAGKKDKILALAWLLQNNPMEKIAAVLGPDRPVGKGSKLSGWQNQEKKAIMFLLKLRDFNPQHVVAHHKARQGTGLSDQQIKSWVDMHKGSMSFPADPGHVKSFAGYDRSIGWDDAVSKQPTLAKMAPHMRGNVLADLEAEKFQKGLSKD